MSSTSTNSPAPAAGPPMHKEETVLVCDTSVEGNPSYRVPLSAVQRTRELDPAALRAGGGRAAPEAGPKPEGVHCMGRIVLQVGKYITEVVVTDPTGDVFAVDAGLVIPSRGLKTYTRMAKRDTITPAALCPNYHRALGGSGACQADQCNFIHVHSSALATASRGTPCCARHGDSEQAGEHPGLVLRVADRGYRLALGRRAATKAPREPTAIVTHEDICTDHIAHYCLLGRDCPKQHVCRMWVRKRGLDRALFRSQLAPNSAEADDASDAATDPSVATCAPPSPAAATVPSAEPAGDGRTYFMCKNFLTGKCQRGERCNYVHVNPSVIELCRLREFTRDEIVVEIKAPDAESVVCPVPAESVLPTKGYESYARHMRDFVRARPLCTDFHTQLGGSGHCPNGEDCTRIHVDAAALADIYPNNMQTPCCWQHGDTQSKREHAMHGVVHARQKWHLPTGRVAKTAATAGPNEWLSTSSVCVRHVLGRCKHGRQCRRFHLCREWLRKILLFDVLVKTKTNWSAGGRGQEMGQEHGRGRGARAGRGTNEATMPPPPAAPPVAVQRQGTTPQKFMSASPYLDVDDMQSAMEMYPVSVASSTSRKDSAAALDSPDESSHDDVDLMYYYA